MNKDHIVAHSEPLAVFLYSQQGSSRTRIKYEVSALCHAMYMAWYFEKLNLVQIRVLFSFLCRLKKRFPKIYFFWPGPSLVDTTDREVHLAGTEKSESHDLAIAYIDRAMAGYMSGFEVGYVSESIGSAIQLAEEVVLKESDINGFRQLVEVYTGAGKICGSDLIRDCTMTKRYLKKALDLATGPAHSPRREVSLIQIYLHEVGL